MLKTRKFPHQGGIQTHDQKGRDAGAGAAFQFGLYDVPDGKETYVHLPVTQDVALRHGGGTNTHMGIGAQYSNAKYGRTMSMGDRIALEIRRALKRRSLAEIVT